MADYALKLNESELARYRFMAQSAAKAEAAWLTAAGVVAGAGVADIGCGPGAMSAVLGSMVGPTGSVRAVDRDPDVLAAARANAEAAGVANVTVSEGDAEATGIEPGSVDTVMMRHVLAHNGGREQAIVDHLATLVRPGGTVYLVDVDLTALRTRPVDAELDEMAGRYRMWHEQRGNDLTVGLRLDELLALAGLEDISHHGRYEIFLAPPGFRTPAWAARDALVAAGLATSDDLDRWNATFARLDVAETRMKIFAPVFVAFGRRPVA